MQSVISEENKVPSFGTSMKFSEIGDKVEGTLVDKRMVSVQKYMSTEMEDKMAYEIKVPKGGVVIDGGVERVLDAEEKFTVWGKPEGKSGIDAQMKTVSLGQIVAFVFEGTKPNKKYPKNPTKLIQVYQNKDIVDKEWLENGAHEESGWSEEESVDEPEMPDFTAEASPESTPVDDDVPFTDTLSEIMKLAKEKFGVATDDEAKAKVIENTSLAFIKPNYDKILEKLQTL